VLIIIAVAAASPNVTVSLTDAGFSLNEIMRKASKILIDKSLSSVEYAVITLFIQWTALRRLTTEELLYNWRGRFCGNEIAFDTVIAL
jgi:hypothetical protein